MTAMMMMSVPVSLSKKMMMTTRRHEARSRE
jgi:hypothetical protein